MATKFMSRLLTSFTGIGRRILSKDAFLQRICSPTIYYKTSNYARGINSYICQVGQRGKKLLFVGKERNQGIAPRRELWGMLNAVFNRPDHSRIKEVGPHRACAEWLLRCGAHVRWQDFDHFQDDYNKLPAGGFRKFKIEEINADNAAVMAIGFPHFDGVETIKKIRFHYCAYLYDDALAELVRLKDSLEDLEISSCGDISDQGLASLIQLINLRRLLLYDLPGVRYKEEALRTLQNGLPNCEIEFKDVHKEKPA